MSLVSAGTFEQSARERSLVLHVVPPFYPFFPKSMQGSKNLHARWALAAPFFQGVTPSSVHVLCPGTEIVIESSGLVLIACYTMTPSDRMCMAGHEAEIAACALPMRYRHHAGTYESTFYTHAKVGMQAPVRLHGVSSEDAIALGIGPTHSQRLRCH